MWLTFPKETTPNRYYTTIKTGPNSTRSGYVYVEDGPNQIAEVERILIKRHSIEDIDWRNRIKEISKA